MTQTRSVGLDNELGPLPEGVHFAERPEGHVDFIHVFIKDIGEIHHFLPIVTLAIKYDGLLWIA
jgi:hypothetical protein